MNRYTNPLRRFSAVKEEQHQQVRQLERSEALQDALIKVQLGIEIDDLTAHQSDYWSWWILEEHREYQFIYEGGDHNRDPIEEVAENFSSACESELEIVRAISDMALELRWMRLAGAKEAEWELRNG